MTGKLSRPVLQAGRFGDKPAQPSRMAVNGRVSANKSWDKFSLLSAGQNHPATLVVA